MGSPVNTISSRNLDNLLINGGMRFDQRRAGSALVISSGTLSTVYVTDRWRQDRLITSTTSTQRLSATPPPGHTHYLNLTVTAGVSVSATQLFEWLQLTEASTLTPTKFGTAQAETLGLSFWVRSSVVGPNSGTIRNHLGNRSYVFAFDITTANTWEYKTIVIPGDTSGTWNLTNQSLVGMVVAFGPSAGADYRTTAGSWQTGIFAGVTGGNNITAVTGATFDLAGVQLNIGAPKPMILEPYADELQKCQRFYEKSYSIEEAVGTALGSVGFWHSISLNNTEFYDYGRVKYQVQKRAAASVSTWSYSGTAGVLYNLSSSINQGNTGIRYQSQNGFGIYCANAAMSTNAAFGSHWAADAEL